MVVGSQFIETLRIFVQLLADARQSLIEYV